jgi:hypothetical protein
MSPLESARAVHAALPEGGLFQEKEWRIAPRPFVLPDGLASELEKLGYRLMLFVRACDQLYRQSVKGRQPASVCEILDAGKPPELVAFQRECGQAGDIPRVIRPDLVLTEEGFVIAEIDSIPGGIGLTGWLGKLTQGSVLMSLAVRMACCVDSRKSCPAAISWFPRKPRPTVLKWNGSRSSSMPRSRNGACSMPCLVVSGSRDSTVF